MPEGGKPPPLPTGAAANWPDRGRASRHPVLAYRSPVRKASWLDRYGWPFPDWATIPMLVLVGTAILIVVSPCILVMMIPFFRL